MCILEGILLYINFFVVILKRVNKLSLFYFCSWKGKGRRERERNEFIGWN